MDYEREQDTFLRRLKPAAGRASPADQEEDDMSEDGKTTYILELKGARSAE